MVYAAAVIAFGMTACSDAETPDDAPASSPDQAQVAPAGGGNTQTVSVPDPNGTYFAEITPNGTGCPGGTANTRISDDGLTFTTTFSAYAVAVNSEKTVDVRDCQLMIKLHTPQGRSFSVQTFSYTGYARIDRGVTGKQMANYYFQGRPVPPRDGNRVDLAGPYDSDYVFRDEVPIRNRVWSPCGLVRDLQVQTLLQLNANQSGATGEMSLSMFEGSSKLEVKVESRPCTGNEPGDTSPTPNPDTSKPPDQNTNPNPDNTTPPNNGNPSNTTPTPGTPVLKPTGVQLLPASIPQDGSFTVIWTPITTDVNALYVVEVRDPLNGERVFWSSPEIVGSGLRYNGPRLPHTGLFRIVVIAKSKGQSIPSESVLLEVRGDASRPNDQTSNPTPNPATLAKPTNLRIAPTAVPRDRPFSISWSAPTNASTAVTYKVQLRSSSQSVIWERETTSLSMTYNGGTLPSIGTYSVVVVARDGNRTSTSDPVQFQATNLLRPIPNN